MKLLDGKALSLKIAAELREVIAREGLTPRLAVVLVGEHPASMSYVKMKGVLAEAAGVAFDMRALPETATTDDVLRVVAELNADTAVSGFIVQLPLPAGVDTARVLAAVDPAKDADGFHPINQGKTVLGSADALVPATPKGVMRLLDAYGIECEGKECVMIGHSNIVGKPLANLLVNRNATVTICHHMTRDTRSHAVRADILLTATGVIGLVKEDWVKEGAVVIDIGIAKNAEGKIVGDTDFERVAPKCSFITPVPGGVGPMTVAALIENTVECARRNRI